jgi:glycosyltransferase involved in cell wall biosynthesis
MRDVHTKPLVSVVTPFFNTAPYLAQCIESVLEQTHPHWEYILLDNCSSDGSADIARHYAAKDDRIRFVAATEFVGQVENYNRALGLISPASTYCKIVQADDWIFPECLERMVHVAASGEHVGLVSSYALYGDELAQDGIPFARDHVLSGHDVGRQYLSSRCGFLGSPTSVMYRSDLVRRRSPFFALDNPCEDVDACLDLLRISDFGFVHQVLTGTRRDNAGYWARVSAFEPLLLFDLILLRRHGAHFLSEHEYRQRWSAVETAYCRMLGHRLVQGAPDDFWEFHRSGLAAAGWTPRRTRVWAQAALYASDLALNPKRAFEAIFRRWLGRDPSGSEGAGA